MKKVLLSALCTFSMTIGITMTPAVYAKTAKNPYKINNKVKEVLLYVDSTTQKTKKLKGSKVKKWKTSNKKVVTVKKGKLTAKKKGNATVTAKTNKKTLKWRIVVKKVALNKKNFIVPKGKTAKISLKGEKIKSIKSSNKKVVSVSKNGVIKGLKSGDALVTVKGNNKKSYVAKVEVTDKSSNLLTTSSDLYHDSSEQNSDLTDDQKQNQDNSKASNENQSSYANIPNENRNNLSSQTDAPNVNGGSQTKTQNQQNNNQDKYSHNDFYVPRETDEQKREKAAAEAATYDYTIEPVMRPFCTFFLVTTTNPKIDNVRLSGVDADGQEVDLEKFPFKFADIKYYDEDKMQIKKDTYLFSVSTHGKTSRNPVVGNLTVEATERESYDEYNPSTGRRSYVARDFAKSSKEIAYPSGMESDVDYLIHKYGDPVNGDLFDKLDAISTGLYSLGVYPKFFCDRNKSNNQYVSLCVSPYQELNLNKHFEIYSEADELFFSEYLYPYVLSSRSYPGLISEIAKKLDPNCTVKSGIYHFLVDITDENNTTKTYGGAGYGSTDCIYSNLVGKDYDFNGQNLADGGLEAIRSKYLYYANESDKITKEISVPLNSDEIAKKVGNGAWIRVGVEGSSYSAYAYEVTVGTGDKAKAYDVKNCWVDGHYIGMNNCAVENAKYADHPYADIILRNQTFTDCDGNKRTGDLWYIYDTEEKCWIAIWSYSNGLSSADDYKEKAPRLTEDQVKNMHLDDKVNDIPDEGYIYDGTAEPGTPFKNS